MEVYTSEQEEVEALKKWWSENGRAVVIGVIIGLAGLFGWQTWSQHRQTQAESASAIYDQILEQLQAGQNAKIPEQADELIQQYAGTPYAALAALAAAKVHVQQDQLAETQTRLQWVLEHASQPDLTAIARLRLAAVYIADSNFTASAALLEQEYPQGFVAQLDELKGDLLVAQGDLSGAKNAYERALAQELPAQKRQFIQLKRDDLGHASIAAEPSA